MTEPVTYRTIKLASYGEYREKGSKFFAFAYPVADEDEIKKYQEELRIQFHDARHHCYAWVLGMDADRFRANDDGEPGHSAGDPILGQIKSEELTNTLIVVIRYFGGTKLGVSGLINAYRTAAARALMNADIISKQVTDEITLTYSYDDTSEVMRLIDANEAVIVHQHFTEKCTITIEINVAYTARFMEKIELLRQTGHEVVADIT